MKSLPGVEMRRGIDHVITVLQRPTARVDPNHGCVISANPGRIIADFLCFEALETLSVVTADAGEFSASHLTGLMEITS